MIPTRSSGVWGAWLFLSMAGTALIALPDPDRRLFSISENHGPGVMDLVGTLLLITGWGVLDVHVWRGRHRLWAVRRALLLVMGITALGGAILVAWSVERDAGRWWLLGAALVAGVQLAAAILASPRGGRWRSRSPRPDGSPGMTP